MPVLPDYRASQSLEFGRTPNVDIGAGYVERGMQGLAQGLATAGDAMQAYQDREKQKQAYDTGLSFEQMNQQLANQHDEMVRNQAPGAEGLAASGQAALQKTTLEWLKTVPSALQSEYAQKVAILAEKYHGAYANAEATGRNSWEIETTKTALTTDQNQAVQAFKTSGNEGQVDAIVKDRLALIDKTTLPPTQKLALKTMAEKAIRESVVKTMGETEAAKALGIPNSSQAVNMQIPAVGRALLDTIAGTESPDYQTRYGGAKFDSFADHPRIGALITSGPNKGKTSAAAGRYQLLPATWDAEAQKLGLKDFSPANQDAAAWDLAKTTYHERTGGNLEQVLQSGDPAQIASVGRALSGKWTSLPGGIETGSNNDKFVSAFLRNVSGVKVASPQDAADAGGHYRATTQGQGGNFTAPDTRYAIFTPEERMSMFSQVQSQAARGRGEMAATLKDDLASVEQTGVGVSGLTVDRVRQVAGDAVAEQWQQQRQVAQRFHDATSDLATLPADAMQQKIATLAPVPGQVGYVQQQNAYAQAQQMAAGIAKQREQDPAGAVVGDPSVAKVAAMASLRNPTTFAPLVAARLAAQTKLGIPDSLQSPMSLSEAQQFSTILKQALPGHERDVLKQVVDSMQQLYGPHTDAALSYMLSQAKFDAPTKAITASMFRKLGMGQVPTPEEARAFDDKTKVAASDQAVAGVIGPTQGNFPVPDTGAIYMLRRQPDLAPKFDQAYGPGRAASILSSTVAPPPLAEHSLTDISEQRLRTTNSDPLKRAVQDIGKPADQSPAGAVRQQMQDLRQSAPEPEAVPGLYPGM